MAQVSKRQFLRGVAAMAAGAVVASQSRMSVAAELCLAARSDQARDRR